MYYDTGLGYPTRDIFMETILSGIGEKRPYGTPSIYHDPRAEGRDLPTLYAFGAERSRSTESWIQQIIAAI